MTERVFNRFQRNALHQPSLGHREAGQRLCEMRFAIEGLGDQRKLGHRQNLPSVTQIIHRRSLCTGHGAQRPQL
jgi:hypothetical protein